MGLKGYHRDATSSIDSPEDILKCLNCRKLVCNNCLRTSSIKGQRYDRSPQVKDLYDEGYNDREIADLIGLTVPTVRYYRIKLGLEAIGRKY